MPSDFSARFKKPMSSKKVDEQINEKGGTFDSITKTKCWTPKEGINKLRIIADPVCLEKYDTVGKMLFVNYGIGPQRQSYLSLYHMKKTKDPIHEAIGIMTANGKGEQAKKISPKKRMLMWVIVKGEEDKGPQLLNLGFQTWQDILRACKDEESGKILCPYDPDEGYTVILERVGKDEQTRYPSPRLARNPSPLSDDSKEALKWLKFVDKNPIDDQLQFYDYKHIKETFTGGATTSEDDDPAADEEDSSEEEERSSKKPRVSREDPEEETEETEEEEKPKSSKKVVKKRPPDEEDEMESEDPEDPGEDEDEAPAPKKKGKKAPVEDEDEESDSSDYEDEDEKPKSSKKTVKKKPEPEEEESESDESEDEDEPAPKKKTVKKAAGKRRVVDDDDD